MSLQLLRCSRCGGELTKHEDLFKCNYCHASFIDGYANQDKVLMDSFDQVKQERIAALRSLQWKAVNEEYLSTNDIVESSKEILKFLPDDFISNFYVIASGNNLNKINKFLDRINVEEQSVFVEDVVRYMLKVAESANILSLEALIDRGIKDRNQITYLNQVHELAEKLDYGVYDTEIPRDVFIAYSSKDFQIVNEVVNSLEANGISCFVAIRNLRHGKGAVENYNQELYKAMHNCEVFVLISTQNSRQPSCDAIRVEMPYFRDKESDKPRIEFVVDNIRENVAVEMKLKKFFGEKEYCRTIEDLLERIMDSMEVKPEEPQIKYCTQCLKEVPLDMKICGYCGSKEFAPTLDEAKDIVAKKALAALEAQRQKEEQERREAEEKARKEAELARALEEQKRKEEQARLEAEEKRRKEEQERLAALEKAREEAKARALEVQRQKEAEILEKAKKEAELAQEKARKEAEKAKEKALKDQKKQEEKERKASLKREKSTVKLEKDQQEESDDRIEFFRAKKRKKKKIIIFSLASVALLLVIALVITLIISNSPNEYNGFTFSIDNGEATITGYNGNDTEIVIPSEVKKFSKFYPVVSIGEDAFANNFGLISVEITSSVTSIGGHAFGNCTNLSSVTFAAGSNLTSIGENAFSNCRSLISVTIPSSVEIIAFYAFQNCSNLVKVIIPSNVASMGFYAFLGCSNLTIYCGAISQPASWNVRWNPNNCPVVWNYKTQTEESPQKMFTYTISGSDATITGFTGSDTELTIPSEIIEGNNHYTVTKIGANAFKNRSGLKEVTIPSSVTAIDDYAFSGCGDLSKIIIPSSVTSIGKYAFSGCSNLASVEIPSSVLSIGKNAFNCSKIKIYCEAPSKPDGWDSEWNPYSRPVVWNYIIQNVESSQKMFTYTISGSEATITGYTGSDTELTIPSEIVEDNKHYTVITIGGTGFQGSNLTSLTIPSSVTSIGANAFYNCDSLTSLTIPANVISIGSVAFENCNNLSSIVFAEGSKLTSIGERAFSNCPSLTQITIPSNVTTIGASAFYNCSKLSSVTFASGSKLTSIRERAFSGCSSLTQITIPSSVTSIGSSAFENCTSLTRIEIPSSVITIGANSFYGCTSLTIYCEVKTKPSNWSSSWNPNNRSVVWDYKNQTGETEATYENYKYIISGSNATITGYVGSSTSLIIPSKIIVGSNGYTVDKIGNNAFKSGSVTSLTIPSSVISIETAAFESCTKLSNVTFASDSKLTSIGERAFSSCTSLTQITIPSSVTSLGVSAFGSCSKLSNVTFASGSKLTSIGNRAFNSCSSLISFELPSGVTSIGNGAFQNCINLTSITIWQGVTTINTSAFDGCNKLTIYCEAKSKPSTWSTTWNSSNCPVVWDCNSQNDFTYTITDSKATITGYTGSDTEIVIPSEIVEGDNHYQVVAIDYYAFQGCSSLTSVTIPNTVTTILKGAFTECSGLTSIVISEGVTTIDSGVFYGCTKLTSIELPYSLTSIGEDVFEGCTKLTDIYYYGTLEDEEKIEIASSNSELFNATWHCRQSTNPVWNKETNTITYGEYPQTVVDDEDLINELNKLTKTNSKGYYEYHGEQYAKVDANPNSTSYTYSNGQAATETYTYFKVEPIMWKVLEENNGEVLIVSEMLLDIHRYDDNSNNYKESEIRAWLNDEFLSKAFNNQSFILTTEVDNSAASTGVSSNQFVCENTYDKIFLLSVSEYLNTKYFSSADRYCKVTDYAIANGTYKYSGGTKDGNGYYYTRSPYDYNGISACSVDQDGYIYSNDYVYSSGRGVRAALWISLEEQKAQTPVWDKESNTITYGEYPQTVVDDEEIINELNKLTITNSKGYYEYNGEQYAKIDANPFASSITYSNNKTATSGYTYFIVEPIIWTILKTDGDKLLVVSNVILDVHRYDDNSNNYKESEIRAWLNNEFLNKAFDNHSFILITEVDNSVASTGDSTNPQACENTTDDIFLLSRAEYNKYFINLEDLCCKVTDYAIANGAYGYSGGSYDGNGNYWTRSPYNLRVESAYRIFSTGGIGAADVSEEHNGVRPALWINLGE